MIGHAQGFGASAPWGSWRMSKARAVNAHALGANLGGSTVPAGSSAWIAITNELGSPTQADIAKGYRVVKGAGNYTYKQYLPSGNIEIIGTPTAPAPGEDGATSSGGGGKFWQILAKGITAATQAGAVAQQFRASSTIPTSASAQLATYAPQQPSYSPEPTRSGVPAWAIVAGVGAIGLVTVLLLMRRP